MRLIRPRGFARWVGPLFAAGLVAAPLAAQTPPPSAPAAPATAPWGGSSPTAMPTGALPTGQTAPAAEPWGASPAPTVSTTAATAPPVAPPEPKAVVPARPAQAPKVAAVPRGKAGKKKAAVPGGPIASYPGFRMLDGGASRVLVTVSQKVAVTETKAEGRLTYRFAGVSVPTRTNRLPLLTAFFSTPVSRATLVEHEGYVDLVIELRAQTTAAFRTIDTDKGMELQVDFPKVATAGDEQAPAAAPVRPAGTTKNIEPGTGAY